MKGSDIVKHIIAELPKYTNLFTTQTPIASLTSVGSVATVEFASPMNFVAGNKITISGAYTYIEIASIERAGNIVKITTSQPHYLPVIDNRPNSSVRGLLKGTITIQNAIPTDYNGVWDVYTSLTEYEITFKIKTAPATPATTTGQVLFNDFDNYNGLKTITSVVSPTTYTYDLQQTTNLPVSGNVFINTTRAKNALSLSHILRNHDQDESGNGQPWVYVVLSAGDNNRPDGVPSDDPTATHFSGNAFNYNYRKTVNIYVVIPFDKTKKNIMQGDIADELHSNIVPALQKVLGNFSVQSPYNQKMYEGFTLISDDLLEELYNGSYCVYGLTLSAEVRLTNQDVYAYEGGVPLKNVDIFFNEGLEAKVEFPW